MKRVYLVPLMQKINLDAADLITTSSGGGYVANAADAPYVPDLSKWNILA